MRMAKWLLTLAACLVRSGASGELASRVSAPTGQGIIFPMLLDFQPIVLSLDPTADVQKQLLQFCVTHLLDLERCHILQDAVASIVQLEKRGGGHPQPCRPSATPLRPAFALVKNLLVATDSTQQQPSFKWLEDSPYHIASDICGFLARSHAANIDVSTGGCATPLADAITASFQWINAAPVCDAHARTGTTQSLHTQSVGNVEKSTATETQRQRLVVVGKISITPWERDDPMNEVSQNRDLVIDEDEEGEEERLQDRPIRMVPIADSGEEATATVRATESTREATTQSKAFTAEALVVVALFAVVMMGSWLKLLLGRQSKSTEVESQSLRSGNAVVPLDTVQEQHSAPAEPVKTPPSEERFLEGFAIVHRVNNRSLIRSALLRWQATVRTPVDLLVETNALLIETHDLLNLTALVDEVEGPALLGIPHSSSTHRRVRSFSLAAMSFLMTPCSPMATSSPRGGHTGGPDTPLARVTRLLEAESATDELLDQFDAARLAAERQSTAARRIQRMWRSSRISSSADKGNAVKRSRLPHPASHLLRRVRRLQSRFSNPREDPVGQSASSA